MEHSGDWCFFKKIWAKRFENSTVGEHCMNLVSVNNTYGWVFVAVDKDLLVIKASDIEAYGTSESLDMGILKAA